MIARKFLSSCSNSVLSLTGSPVQTDVVAIVLRHQNSPRFGHHGVDVLSGSRNEDRGSATTSQRTAPHVHPTDAVRHLRLRATRRPAASQFENENLDRRATGIRGGTGKRNRRLCRSWYRHLRGSDYPRLSDTRDLDPKNLHHMNEVFRPRPSPRQRGVIKKCKLARRSLDGLRRSLARGSAPSRNPPLACRCLSDMKTNVSTRVNTCHNVLDP